MNGVYEILNGVGYCGCSGHRVYFTRHRDVDAHWQCTI